MKESFLKHNYNLIWTPKSHSGVNMEPGHKIPWHQAWLKFDILEVINAQPLYFNSQKMFHNFLKDKQLVESHHLSFKCPSHVRCAKSYRDFAVSTLPVQAQASVIENSVL